MTKNVKNWKIYIFGWIHQKIRLDRKKKLFRKKVLPRSSYIRKINVKKSVKSETDTGRLVDSYKKPLLN
jgi:hypothetical protein